MTDDKAEAARLHTELINVVHAWEAQRNRADAGAADRDRAVSALNEHGRSAVGISGDLEDGINADHLMATAERDGLLAALAATEADRDRARDAAVALEQENARLAEQPAEEEYDAAIERLGKVFRDDAEVFIGLLESVRDEETVHSIDPETGKCTGDCIGCLAERLADAITRTTNGGETP